MSDCVVKLTFLLIFYLNLIINVDHGVMPAGTVYIKDSLNLNNKQYGLLGSVVFFGLVLGSLAATVIFNKFKAKVALVMSMILIAAIQVAFTYTEQFELLLACRFAIGFFQVFITIYWPVWTDAFAASDQRKNTWMSSFLAASIVGVLIGYVLTTQLIINYTW